MDTAVVHIKRVLCSSIRSADIGVNRLSLCLHLHLLYFLKRVSHLAPRTSHAETQPTQHAQTRENNKK